MTCAGSKETWKSVSPASVRGKLRHIPGTNVSKRYYLFWSCVRDFELQNGIIARHLLANSGIRFWQWSVSKEHLLQYSTHILVSVSCQHLSFTGTFPRSTQYHLSFRLRLEQEHHRTFHLHDKFEMVAAIMLPLNVAMSLHEKFELQLKHPLLSIVQPLGMEGDSVISCEPSSCDIVAELLCSFNPSTAVFELDETRTIHPFLIFCVLYYSSVHLLL